MRSIYIVCEFSDDSVRDIYVSNDYDDCMLFIDSMECLHPDRRYYIDCIAGIPLNQSPCKITPLRG